MTVEPDVIIIGAGIAGLSCASHLVSRGIRPLVLEAGDAPGGRMRSDNVQGFTLDRGFQVFLTAYPEARHFSEALGRLKLNKFEPGALIRYRGKFHKLGDPFRKPASAPQTLLAPVGSVFDKWLVAALRMNSLSATDEQIGESAPSADERLKEFGFSEEMINAFFRPFFGGIFLDRSLAQSSKMMEFLFAMFSSGDIVVPSGGMQAIPQQLAQSLPSGSIRYDAPVAGICDQSVHLVGGEVLTAREIVIATEETTARALLGTPALRRAGRDVTCLYYACDSAPTTEKILVLNGDGEGPINNLTVMSNVAPDYSADGRALVSVSVLGDPNIADSDLLPKVQQQLCQWYGAAANSWKHLRTYRIHEALPGSGVAPLIAGTPKVRDGLHICGDHTQYASINGAMKSGRLVASQISKVHAAV